MPPVLVGTYARRIDASVARIWENVLDWEHLPWLHRDTFASIHLEHQDAAGWRAVASLHDRLPFTIEVTIDRAAGAYHSRTLAGAGGDIFTRLNAVTATATDILVEFWVPEVRADHVQAVGAFYRDLYARLWDEDEVMMQRRQRLLDAPPPGPAPAILHLGTRHAVQARLPFVVETAVGPVRVLDDAGTLRAHPTTCPHLQGPLDEAPLDDGCITCPWHGYRFDLRHRPPAAPRGRTLQPRFRVDTGTDGQVTLSVE